MLILLAALAKGTTLWVAWARSDHLAVAFRLTQARHIKRACGQQQTNKQQQQKGQQQPAQLAQTPSSATYSFIVHSKRVKSAHVLTRDWKADGSTVATTIAPVPGALPSVAALREHSNAETACVFACVCLCFLM